MTTLLKKQTLKALLWLRQQKVRQPIIRMLVWLHNTSYHAISFFASYQGIHPKHEIMRYENFFLDNISSQHTVLDVGSGNGKIAYEISKKAYHITGIDIRSTNIARATKSYQRENLHFIQGDATTIEFKNSFDIIILSNVLEHIENRVDFLKKLSGIAPCLLIRVPLLTRDWVTVFKKNEGLEYRLDDTHYIEYTVNNFRHEMKLAELAIDRITINFGEIYAVVRKN